MKIVYKPFGIIAGLVAARLGRKTFKQIWGKIDEQDPPDPSTEEASMGKVVGAAALEAATMAAVAAAVSRTSANTFHYLFGIWPGKNKEKQLPEKTRTDGGSGRPTPRGGRGLRYTGAGASSQRSSPALSQSGIGVLA